MKSHTTNAAEFNTTQDNVFGRIAARYDLLCDLFSLGIHRIWKNKVANIISSESWVNMLDAASGTGDIVLRLLRKKTLRTEQNIIASDISPKMLAIAKRKLKGYKANLDFRLLDMHKLDGIDNDSIDLYSMSLGLKICDRDKALEEAYRVLKPGGRLVVLEASNIPISWIHKLYLGYMSMCMPLIGWIATRGDASAYKYLLQGVKDFPSAEILKQELELKGYEDVTYKRMSFGIVAIHIAYKIKV